MRFVLQMGKIYELNLTVRRCKVHESLNMGLDYSDKGVVKTFIIQFLKNISKSFLELIKTT